MVKILLHILVIAIMPLAIQAHEIRPAYLEIREQADHGLRITWKQPMMGDYGLALHPSISAGWFLDSTSTIAHTEAYLVRQWAIPAGHEPLDGQVIRIDGLEKTITDVFVQVSLEDGRSFTWLIKPVHPELQLNLAKRPSPPVWQYIQLGIFHIWSGFDHLLFVLGLIILVKGRKRLVWTITAFTLAHSITLALATLHIVKVSTSFTEAAIALSIVFLAVEILHHQRGRDGLASKYPWLVSFLFGLLHGLGFASALQDVGLPEGNVPLALFLFNLGVEIGQLTFVLAIFTIASFIKRFRIQWPTWTFKIPGYLIGILAMYWFLDRFMSI